MGFRRATMTQGRRQTRRFWVLRLIAPTHMIWPSSWLAQHKAGDSATVWPLIRDRNPHMAERSQRTRLVPQLDDDEGWRLSGKAWQLALWGSAALAAVAMAFAAASTEAGSQRLSQATASAPEPSSLRITPRQMSFEIDADVKRISEAVRLLAADRDRLQTRVSTLEHMVEDATGAISVGAATGRPSEPSVTSPT